MEGRTRRIVVEVDADDIEWAAEWSKETVPQFVAMSIALAMSADADEGEERVISMTVDGEPFVIVHTEGETEEQSRTFVS